MRKSKSRVGKGRAEIEERPSDKRVINTSFVSKLEAPRESESAFRQVASRFNEV